MADEILLAIAKAEEQAAETERAAEKQARERIADAHADAKRLLEEGLLEDERSFFSARKAHSTESESQTAEMVLEADRQADEMKKKTAVYMDEAVSIIVEGVVNTYGHS